MRREWSGRVLVEREEWVRNESGASESGRYIERSRENGRRRRKQRREREEKGREGEYALVEKVELLSGNVCDVLAIARLTRPAGSMLARPSPCPAESKGVLGWSDGVQQSFLAGDFFGRRFVALLPC
jgi:hypothetical protein